MRRFAVVVLVACGSSSTTAPPTTPSPAPAAATQPVIVRDDALDEHRRALVDVDAANPRAVDRALMAAEALGEKRDATAIDALGALALRAPSVRLRAVQVAAIRALGRMSGDQTRASEALLKIVERELPPRPVGGMPAETYAMHLAALGATINALAELGNPRAIAMLVPVVYRTPELMSQLRRAFASAPSIAAAEFRKVLRREHAAVEALVRDRLLDKYCGDRGDAQSCEAVSARDFYAAIVLGDVRDESAIDDLFAALKQPALPPYYVDDTPAPTTQHTAIFDALRKIASPSSAGSLRDLWSDPKIEAGLRTGAVGAYAFAVSDVAAIDAIWKIAADNTARDELRIEAATAYARLSRESKHIGGFLQLAKKYSAAAAKKRAAADKQAAVKRAADDELAKVRDAADAARAKLLATTQDQTTTADQIRAATEVAKQAQAAFKDAKAKHREKTAAYTSNDTAAKAYVGYARMFQTHVARVELAVRCADSIDCYASALRTTAADAVLQLRAHIPDVDTWSDDDKQGLVEAYVDRAALELRKRKATTKLDALLDALASEDRVIREAILLALPRLAPTSCAACITKLDAALEAGKSKPYLAPLQVETQIVRNYLESR